MKKIYSACIIVLIIVFLAGSCTTANQKPVSASGQPQSIVFVDADFFDSQLSNIMAEQSSGISVSFAQPVTLSTIPERLDKWLYVLVNRYSGSVDVKNDPAYPAPKDVSAVVMAVAMNVYAYIKEYVMYRPVKNYNAIIYIIPGKTTITRVTFDLK